MRNPMTAERIAAIRRQLGLTQVELAARLDVTQHTISRWEQGHRQPDRYNTAQLTQMEAEMSNLDQYVHNQRANADATGRAAMDAVGHAIAHDLSPLALHLAGNAAMEAAHGTTSAAWIMERLERGGVTREQLEAVISELMGAGLWPWQ